MCILRVNLKISEQMSKSGFFTSRSYIGRDLGFSSKIGRMPDEIGVVGQDANHFIKA